MKKITNLLIIAALFARAEKSLAFTREIKSWEVSEQEFREYGMRNYYDIDDGSRVGGNSDEYCNDISKTMIYKSINKEAQSIFCYASSGKYKDRKLGATIKCCNTSSLKCEVDC